MPPRRWDDLVDISAYSPHEAAKQLLDKAAKKTWSATNIENIWIEKLIDGDGSNPDAIVTFERRTVSQWDIKGLQFKGKLDVVVIKWEWTEIWYMPDRAKFYIDAPATNWNAEGLPTRKNFQKTLTLCMWELANMARTKDEDEAAVNKTIKTELSVLVGVIQLDEILNHKQDQIMTPKEIRKDSRLTNRERRKDDNIHDAQEKQLFRNTKLLGEMLEGTLLWLWGAQIERLKKQLTQLNVELENYNRLINQPGVNQFDPELAVTLAKIKARLKYVLAGVFVEMKEHEHESLLLWDRSPKIQSELYELAKTAWFETKNTQVHFFLRLVFKEKVKGIKEEMDKYRSMRDIVDYDPATWGYSINGKAAGKLDKAKTKLAWSKKERTAAGKVNISWVEKGRSVDGSDYTNYDTDSRIDYGTDGMPIDGRGVEFKPTVRMTKEWMVVSENLAKMSTPQLLQEYNKVKDATAPNEAFARKQELGREVLLRLTSEGGDPEKHKANVAQLGGQGEFEKILGLFLDKPFWDEVNLNYTTAVHTYNAAKAWPSPIPNAFAYPTPEEDVALKNNAYWMAYAKHVPELFPDLVQIYGRSVNAETLKSYARWYDPAEMAGMCDRLAGEKGVSLGSEPSLGTKLAAGSNKWLDMGAAWMVEKGVPPKLAQGTAEILKTWISIGKAVVTWKMLWEGAQSAFHYVRWAWRWMFGDPAAATADFTEWWTELKATGSWFLGKEAIGLVQDPNKWIDGWKNSTGITWNIRGMFNENKAQQLQEQRALEDRKLESNYAYTEMTKIALGSYSLDTLMWWGIGWGVLSEGKDGKIVVDPRRIDQMAREDSYLRSILGNNPSEYDTKQLAMTLETTFYKDLGLSWKLLQEVRKTSGNMMLGDMLTHAEWRSVTIGKLDGILRNTRLLSTDDLVVLKYLDEPQYQEKLQVLAFADNVYPATTKTSRAKFSRE